MVTHILSLQQLPCNERNSFIANEQEIRLPTTNRANYKTNIDENSWSCTSNSYLGFSSAQKIIHNLLSYDRVVLLPQTIPRFTEFELAKKLNITIHQLRHLQKLPKIYKRMAKHICLSLTSLYCSSTLQQPKSNHDGGTHHE
ncbi:hypothetical protein GAMM_90023 [Gammaproteobacteria bacterium]